MVHSLRPDLHYCDTGAHIIFLDVAAGRYFSIPPSWNAALRQCLARAAPLDHPDFATAKLVTAGILCEERDEGPRRDPEQFVAPTQIWARAAPRAPRPSIVLQACWHQLRVASDLKRHGFRQVIRALDQRWKSAPRAEAPDVAVQIHRLNAAFALAELAISKADNCLVRSIALLRMLRAAGADGVLVIGVTASPFSAHAWVQRGTVLLNDDLDRVRIFSPILIV